MTNILITAIGGDIAQSVALIIRKHFPYMNIIGCDCAMQHIQKKFVDKFCLVPKANNADYINKINDFIRHLSIDIVIPLNEDEINIISKNIKLCDKKKFIIPNGEAIKIGVDKFLTYKKLKKIGISVPWTLLTTSSMPSEYPCIVKSRTGSGSKQFRIIKNKKQALKFYKKRGFIFQQLLKPANKEITCAIHRNLRGETRTILLLRRLKGGFTSWAKIIKDNLIIEECNKVAEELKLTGSINIQLIKTKFGPRIFEINPRFSSTVLMRDKVYFQDLKWSIQEHLGEKVIYKRTLKNRVLIKKSISDIKVLKIK